MIVINNPDNPGTPVFAHYTSDRGWYAPHDLAKVNNSEIERVTKMDKKVQVEKLLGVSMKH